MSDRQIKIKNFLNTIGKIESSGGTDYDHNLIQKGIHKGHRAAGRYGLMPNTVTEVVNRARMNGTLTPELEALGKLDPETMKAVLECNTELEDQVAERLADHVLKIQLEDEEKAAYSWHQGHNLTPDRIEEKPYKESDYVKKYNMYKLGGVENE